MSKYQTCLGILYNVQRSMEKPKEDSQEPYISICNRTLFLRRPVFFSSKILYWFLVRQAKLKGMDRFVLCLSKYLRLGCRVCPIVVCLWWPYGSPGLWLYAAGLLTPGSQGPRVPGSLWTATRGHIILHTSVLHIARWPGPHLGGARWCKALPPPP